MRAKKRKERWKNFALCSETDTLEDWNVNFLPIMTVRQSTEKVLNENMAPKTVTVFKSMLALCRSRTIFYSYKR